MAGVAWAAVPFGASASLSVKRGHAPGGSPLWRVSPAAGFDPPPPTLLPPLPPLLPLTPPAGAVQGVTPPTLLRDEATGTSCMVSEIVLYQVDQGLGWGCG